MGPQYQPEELLRLRDSPLVRKPSSLSPAEEWMGPPQEQTQKKPSGTRGRQEGSFGNEPHGRPSLLETRQISGASGNVPSDIVLGPPKTAFASASALRSPRQFDSPSRTAFGNFGGDASRGDYFGQRSRNTGEREGREEKSRDSTGPKSRFDIDDWSGPRSARNFGSREEGTTRRYGDREGSDEVRKVTSRGRDFIKREGDENRRNGAGRGSRPSWFKDEDTPATAREGTMEGNKSREWREADKGQRRGGEREWARSTRPEQDPEWMAEAKTEEKKDRHTAKDIEQWKAAMRAQAQGTKEGSASSEHPNHLRSTSGSTIFKTKLDTPLTAPSNGADSFFNIWDRPKVEQSTTETTEDSGKAQQLRQAPPKSSRFTGFFSPQPVTTPREIEIPVSSANQSAAGHFSNAEESALHTYNAVFDEKPNDDKAGFERMLQMLRNPQAGAAEPQAGQGRVTPDQGQRVEDTNGGEAQIENPRHSPKVLSPKSQRTHGFENLLGLQSPREGAPAYNKDTEFLLNLLRKDDTWKQSFPGLGQASKSNAPGILPHPNVMAQFQNPRSVQENGPNPFAEDTKPEYIQAHDKLNPTIASSRPQRQPGLMDEPNEPHHFAPPFPMGNPIPPGLPGPPGFDHPPPPGFSSYMSPQQQNPRGGPMAPPPGFPTPTRNPNPGHFPPGLGPRMANLNLGGPDRGPPPPPPMGMPPGPGPFMGGPPPFPPHSAGFPMMGGGGGGPPFGNGPGGRPLDAFGGGGGDFGGNGGGGRGAGPGGLPMNGGFPRPD